MSSNKYIISLTTIPSRINYIETTIKSLVEQTLKPEKIILNIPKKYNFRFESSIDNITIKKILNKYIDDIIINYIDDDYGPGTKLLGVIKSSIISLDLKDTYIVLVDDDHIYKPFMLECFNNYNAEHHDNKLKIASFYCYNSYGVVIGQGADSIFIRLEMLNNFEDYYDIIKNYDYINYHDDWYISYYFHLKQIEIEYIKLADDSSIYTKQISSDIDALLAMRNQNNRINLNNKVNEILSKLNNEGKFDEVKKKSSEECIFSNCYFYSFSNLKNVYSLSFPRFKLYCGYHSYNYSFYHDNLETVYKPHWNKILYGMKLLKKNLNVKYFIWLDHDIIIKNFDIKIHQIIKDYNFENNKANFMMSEDPISGLNFNSGVCIFKNNVKTLAVFNKMIDNRNNPTNHPSFEKYFEEKYSCGKRMDWLDFHKKGSLQDTRTFLFHFHENPEDLLSVPHRVLQSFYPYHIDRPLHQYKLGDFCGHVAGPQGKKLIQYMNDLINIDPHKQCIDNTINYSNYTMVNNKHISQIQKFVRYINDNNIEGSIVECGVWKGGIMMACINEQKKYNQNRDFYLYDTYDGFTEPKSEKDLLADKIKYKNLTNNGLKWHKIDLETVKNNISKCNYDSNKINYVKGDVLETLNHIYPNKISILRLDTDWYELTKKELEVLYDKVSHKGFIIIDDYNNKDTEGNPRGARIACDEFFCKIKSEMIEIKSIKTNTELDSETIPYCFQRFIYSNIISKTNCEIITTTLSNNKISELRKENIINNFQKKYEFNINFIEGVKYDNWGKNEQFQTTLKMLKTFEKSNYKYGIICQDDFFPIDNFLQELNTTIELLPDTWECLHLCPGFLWGRQFRDKSKIGQYCPEYNMDKTTFNYHKSGRFFIDCNPKEYYDHNLWLGGPVAFIIKHACITQFIHKYKQNFDHDDRTLVNMLNNNTFICRNPQLGYEEECGGTTLK